MGSDTTDEASMAEQTDVATLSDVSAHTTCVDTRILVVSKPQDTFMPPTTTVAADRHGNVESVIAVCRRQLQLSSYDDGISWRMLST